MDSSDKKKDLGSLLKAAATAAPLGFTAFHVGQRIRMRATNIIPTERSAVQAVKFAASRLKVDIPTPTQHLDLLDKMKGSPFYKTKEGGELARMAWNQAAESATARSRRPVAELTRKLMEAPLEQVTDALGHLATKHQGSVYASTYRKFTKNISALERHYSLLGTLPALEHVHYKGSLPNVIKDVSGLPEWMQPYLKSWESHGIKLTQANQYMRPGIEQSTYMLYMRTKRGQGFGLMLPSVHGGIVRESESLRTSYIHRNQAIFDPASGYRNVYLKLWGVK